MPIPILSIAQMRAWEAAAWESGRRERDVIERVGQAVAKYAMRLTAPGDLVLVLAGSGNNGADARAAIPHLKDRQVKLLDVLDPVKLLPDVEQWLARRPALVIDALFGIGLNRLLSEEWARLVSAVNRSESKVLSVDVPSGFNADAGALQGTTIKAAITLTVGAPKAGMLATDAAPLIGRLAVTEEVGLGACPVQTDLHWIQAGDFHGFPPARLLASHKGTYGHLAILAGSEGYHGAAVLCARGAQRARPGLVTVLATDPVYPAVASQLQAVMVSKWGSSAVPGDSWTAIVAGPGLAGAEITNTFGETLRRLWREFNGPVVVDASGLQWIEPGPLPAGLLRVITPHPGEVGRMLGHSTAAVQEDRPKALRQLSERFGGTWVVLKGYQTLVGRNTGTILVNSSGNPHLAQGGSGDLLAGYIGGLLAQTNLRTSPSRTLSYGVWQHGATADMLDRTRANWVVEDLAEAIGSASPCDPQFT